MNDRKGKALRTIAIIFMGLTAAMNVLGGAGTVCAAFLTKQFPPMWVFMDYQLLYQALNQIPFDNDKRYYDLENGNKWAMYIDSTENLEPLNIIKSTSVNLDNDFKV